MQCATSYSKNTFPKEIDSLQKFTMNRFDNVLITLALDNCKYK